MPKELKWIRQTTRYANGLDAFLGTIKVGQVNYSSFVSREDPLKYTASTTLPGLAISREPVRFATEEQAKERVEKAVNAWFTFIENE